jgi:lactoylglutathione lyase
VRIEHVAVWTRDLERLRDFYVRWFGARANAKYARPGFESYFLSFESGARLELMRSDAIPDGSFEPATGLAHLAVAVGSEERVDELTADLRAAGHPVVGGPRRTGDGYYESVVLDPDGNRVEVTA